MPDVKESARDRLVAAAYELFEEQGYDGTTVDDIAQRAGVGRSTFFRTFGTKEDVIFPDHDVLLARINERLDASGPDTRRLALVEAAAIPLRHYVAEGDVARLRYRLTRTVPTLKAREIAGLRAYQRLFGQALTVWWADRPDGALRAELVAAGIVTAHNHVLRRWLQGVATAPERELASALALVLARDSAPAQDGASVVVVTAAGDPDTVAERIRAALLDQP